MVVKEVDPDSYLAETRTRDFTLAMSTWIGDYADPLTFLQLWTMGSNLNDAHFSDSDYDAAVKDSMSITDVGKRYRRLADAEQILLTKAAILPLDHSPAINLINTNSVDGWYSNPLDIHPFKFLKYKSRVTPRASPCSSDNARRTHAREEHWNAVGRDTPGGILDRAQ